MDEETRKRAFEPFFTTKEQEFVKNPDQYDLVITNMAMPSMTGAELAQKIIGTPAKAANHSLHRLQ